MVASARSLSRYGFQARENWLPPSWVVVDRTTGLTVSKYASQDEAKDAAEGLNVHKKRGLR